MAGIRTDVKLTGVTRVLAAFGAISSNIRAQALAPALDDAAELVADEARRRVRVKTGALKRSIRVVPAKTTGSQEVTGAVEATADHAAPVEFGHTTRSGTKVKAQPFLGPAAKAISQNRINAVARGRLAAFLRGVATGG